MDLKFKDKEVSITSLYQWHTYENLMAGAPHEALNQQILKGLPQRAMQLTDIDHYLLLEPKPCTIEMGEGNPFPDPVSLPSVVCVVGLRGTGTSDPAVGGSSSLTLICFQQTWSPPFAPEVLHEIERHTWFSHAKDISWDDY